MKFNVFLYVASAAFCSASFFASAQEEEAPPFREPLFFSDIDRDNRSPQAVRVGGVVFVSAMSGPGGSLEEQTRSSYIRLQSVLGSYGLTMKDVAQERIYLKEGVAWGSLSQLRALFYGEGAGPAKTLVNVSGFENQSTLIAIEMIAVANPESE